MLYQSRITNATRRTTLVLVFLCLCGINAFAADDNSEGNLSRRSPPVATSLTSPPRNRSLLLRRRFAQHRHVAGNRQDGRSLNRDGNMVSRALLANRSI